jgi:hypothetical protein
MAKVECFTPDGKMEMKEPVDAKEAVKFCDYTMGPPELVSVALDKPVDKMNKDELIAKASSLDIDLDGSEKKQDLLDLIEIAEQE